MRNVQHRDKIGPVSPNQPKTPIYGFRYPRKDQVERLVQRWGGKAAGIELTTVGIFAVDEFLERYGDSPNPPPAMLREEGEK